MNSNQVTIRKYLKKGTKIWDWINYSPEEETLKRIKNWRNNKNKLNRDKRKVKNRGGRQVEIFKEGKSLGVFISVADLERKSKEEFGVKLTPTAIFLVCNGKRSHHKGFTFKFVEDQNNIIPQPTPILYLPLPLPNPLPSDELAITTLVS